MISPDHLTPGDLLGVKASDGSVVKFCLAIKCRIPDPTGVQIYVLTSEGAILLTTRRWSILKIVTIQEAPCER